MAAPRPRQRRWERRTQARRPGSPAAHEPGDQAGGISSRLRSGPPARVTMSAFGRRQRPGSRSGRGTSTGVCRSPSRARRSSIVCSTRAGAAEPSAPAARAAGPRRRRHRSASAYAELEAPPVSSDSVCASRLQAGPPAAGWRAPMSRPVASWSPPRPPRARHRRRQPHPSGIRSVEYPSASARLASASHWPASFGGRLHGEPKRSGSHVGHTSPPLVGEARRERHLDPAALPGWAADASARRVEEVLTSGPANWAP